MNMSVGYWLYRMSFPTLDKVMPYECVKNNKLVCVYIVQ